MNSDSQTSDINLDILDQHNNVVDVSSSTNNSSTDLHLGSLINPEKTKIDFNGDNDITDVLSSLSESNEMETESESDSDSDSEDEKDSVKNSVRKSESFTSPRKSEKEENTSKPKMQQMYSSFFGKKKEDNEEILNESSMNESEIRVKKSNFIRKLKKWKERGFELLDEVSFHDSFSKIQEVYNETKIHVNKQNGMEYMKKFILGGVAFIETMNHEFDPLDFQLDGWSDHMNLSMDEDETLNDVIEELYDKYNGVGREIPPEIRLFLIIAMSGAGYHMSKKRNSNPSSSRRQPEEDFNVSGPKRRRNLNDSESDTNNDRILY